MVDVGRRLSGGAAGTLSRQIEAAEAFTATGPFGLAVLGASIHWFDLPAVCTRLNTVLREGAPLAVCDRSATCAGLDRLTKVIRRYSRAPDHDPSYRVAADLEERHLWHANGVHATAPIPFRQSVDDFIQNLHSTATLARELMDPDEAASFDREIHEILSPLADPGGVLVLSLTSTITWGILTPNR